MTYRPTCRGCEYGEALREPTSFRCRRHAPRPGTGNSEGIAWPVVAADDWCGEYLRRGFLEESAEPLESFRAGASRDDG